MPDINVEKRELSNIFAHQTYQLDFYQRDYQWNDRQVIELLQDLTNQFDISYQKNPKNLSEYDTYFLGSYIVDKHRENNTFIVDGQQRLTTLTLLFIYLNNIKANPGIHLDQYVFSYDSNLGVETYIFQIPEREAIFRELLDNENKNSKSDNKYIQNYSTIKKFFEEKNYSKHELLWFANWLVRNVKMIEIDAGSNAYNIFITMNDRGLDLVADELLKGHIFSKIKVDRQSSSAQTWDSTINLLKQIDTPQVKINQNSGAKTTVSQFIIDWITSKHARNVKDVNAIAAFGNGRGFHKWIIENSESLGLFTSDDYENFVQKMNWYARQYVKISQATTYHPETEPIYFAHTTGLTHTRKILLSSLQYNMSDETVLLKLNQSAKMIDCWIGTWKWNNLSTEAHATREIALNLMQLLNDNRTEEAIQCIKEYAKIEPTQLILPQKGKHGVQATKQNIRWILARLTGFIEQQQNPTKGNHYEDFISSKNYHIEHIVAKSSKNNFYPVEDTEREEKFSEAKNRLGNLILLRGKENSSLQDKPYEEKVSSYSANNKLAGILDSTNYTNGKLTTWTSLRDLNETLFNGLIQPYSSFSLEQIKEREKLYLAIASYLWSL